jgi:putative ABC transport system permease protein
VSVIWRKVLRDLWMNRLRTLLVVLATTVGVFALGLVFGLSGLMRARMTESHQASMFPNVILYTDRFEQDFVEAMRQERGVSAVEGEDYSTIRWRLAGEQDWRDGVLYARQDYTEQQVDLFELVDGYWPGHHDEATPADDVVAVERQSSTYFKIPMGATIEIDAVGRVRRLPIVGLARNTRVYPPQFGGDPVFYTTLETAARLQARDAGFSMLALRLEPPGQARVPWTDEKQAGTFYSERVERQGFPVWYLETFQSDVHWFQSSMDGVLLILSVLGLLSLGLSGFLIANIMNATVTQQVWQIGVMKAVGATRGRVLRVYLVTALFYGALSLVFAIPLSAVAAKGMAGWLLDLLNIPVGSMRIIPQAVVLQTVMALVVPGVAALIPAYGGSRIRVARALSTYGIGGHFGSNWLDRLVGRVKGLPRPLALSLRNTFRRKTRLALTMISLLLAGLTFMMVMSLKASADGTIDVLIQGLGFDVLVGFDRAHNVHRLESVASEVPGVDRAEVWAQIPVELEPEVGEPIQLFVWGVPGDSQLYAPRIVAGRNLRPEDRNAIVLNVNLAEKQGLQVGDRIQLTVGERAVEWEVVGLMLKINYELTDNFVPFDALARATRSAGRGGLMMVRSTEDSPQARSRLMEDLKERFTAEHMEPATLQSADETRAQAKASFNIIVYLVLAMAILAASVGAVGLLSTFSINVYERRREIGVMRAIGATTRSVAGIYIAEGVIVGALSWILAAPVSYLASRFFSNAVGMAIMEAPLEFRYSIGGVLGWLALVTLIGAVASLWPARNAARVSVREALSYE